MIWSGFGSANAWGCERFTLSSSHSHLQAKWPGKQPTPGWTFHWDGVNVALRMPGASPTLCISPEYVTKRRFWDSSGPHLGQFWQPAQLLSCYSACCEPWDEPATSHHACLSPATARLPGETSATVLYSTTQLHMPASNPTCHKASGSVMDGTIQSFPLYSNTTQRTTPVVDRQIETAWITESKG